MQAAAADADLAIVAYASLSVPAAGLIVAGFIAGVEALWSTQPAPCTITGCESTFGLGTCDHWPAGNPFLWSSISQTLLPALPAGQPYHFSGGPDLGPSNMIDWGSYDWQDSTPLDPTKPGGPGSFEQALQLSVMSLWDSLASAPTICNTIKAAGLDGNLLEDGLRNGVMNMLVANAGALVPIFLAGWNAGHTTGTVTTEVACTQESCEAAGGIWISSDGSCGMSGGTAVPCTSTSPAPQRQISHTSGSFQYDDPVSVALEGLAQLSNIPAGATLTILVNSGPPSSASGGWGLPNFFGGTLATAKPTSGLAIVGTAVAVVALAAGGYSLWALAQGQAQSEAWSSLFKGLAGQSQKSGQLLLGAGESKKKKRKKRAA